MFESYNYDTALYRKTISDKDEKTKKEDPTNPVHCYK